MAQAHRFFSEFAESEILQLFESWQSEYPESGVLIYLAEEDRHIVPQLQSLARKSGTKILGAIFPSLIHESIFQSRGMLILRLDQFPDYSIIDCSDINNSDQVVASVQQLVKQSSAEDGSLFLIFDALVPNIATLLDKIYLSIGRQVRYLGCNAGSETFQPMPCLFDANVIVGHAVLGMVLSTHPGAYMEHGYQQPDTLTAATSVSGNSIASIDWRPAFEVYQQLSLKHYGQNVTADNFYELGVHFPFGILRADGTVLVRIPVALGEDGSLVCVGEVPENSILTLLEAVPLDVSETVGKLSQRIRESGCLAKSDEMMVFYCAGRKLHMQSDADDELAALMESMSEKTCFGAVSLGEIGSFVPSGYPLFHNATIVLTPWT